MTTAKTFKGRPALGGETSGNAAVSRVGFNATATYMEVLFKNSNSGVCKDHDNGDIYGVDLAGSLLCIPKTIGSSAAACMYMTIVERGIAPRAMLFADHIDTIAACGLIMADNWAEGERIITIDQLGEEFLEAVNTGDRIEVLSDGTVTVYS